MNPLPPYKSRRARLEGIAAGLLLLAGAAICIWWVYFQAYATQLSAVQLQLEQRQALAGPGLRRGPRAAQLNAADADLREETGYLLEAAWVSLAIATSLAGAFGWRWAQLRRRELEHAENRRWADSALGKSQARYHDLVSSLSEAVFQTDSDGNWTFLNPAWEEITGFTVAESLGAPMFDFVHPADRKQAAEQLGQIGPRKWTSFRRELRLNTPRGGFRWVEIFARPRSDEDGAPLGLIGTLNDVSERKNTAEALALNEERLKLALESSELGLWDWDLANDRLYFDERWAQAHGRVLGELRGNGEFWRNLIHGADREEFDTAVREHQAGTRHMIDVEYRAIGPGEECLWVRARGRTVSRSPEGKPLRLLGTLDNVTVHKKLEARLQKARETAEAVDRSKSEFLAMMSHEIRTPMNGIIGFANFLLDSKLDHRQREFAEMLRTCSESLLTLINELLDFSKIESGNLQLEHEGFSPRRCAQEALGVSAQAVAAKGLELTCLFGPGAAEPIRGDATRLRQVLVNLVSNAVKFTEAGEVALRVEVAGENGARRLCFTVRDTGIGIPTAGMERLFRPFSQADSSTTRRYGGTGLGLAICKRLVTLMGGGIVAESRPGEGALFRFTIAAPLERETALPSPSILTGCRVLVLDDHASAREALAAILLAWDMECTAVATPEQAVAELAGPRPYDLALIDAHLAEGDGLEAARLIRVRHRADALPLILLSPLEATNLAQPARAAGMQAIVSKPVGYSHLHDAIATALWESKRLIKPLPRTPDGTPAGTLAVRLGETYPLRILVAEDFPVNQRIIEIMLKKIGYRPDIVPTGKAAVEAVGGARYDLILMDMHMPEMDGLEATREIRRLEQSGTLEHPIHIIALTADALVGDREKCLAAGMNDYLTKPLRPQDLRGALQRYVQN